MRYRTAVGLLAVLLPSALAIAGPARSSGDPARPPERSDPPSPASGAGQPNPMHPTFVALDEAGVPVVVSGRPASSEKTCGACHDAVYIQAAGDHWNDRVHATCAQCHFQGGEIPRDRAAYDESGRLRREEIRISAPRDENCASCHGIVHAGPEPLAIPADFGPRPERTEGEGPPDAGHTYDLSLSTGEILSPQDQSASFLNLRGKDHRAFPWDVHARRLVKCIDCHFAANNPAKADVRQAKLDFVKDDPRRIALSSFLRRPDHHTIAAGCRSCHDPEKTHAFLPYKARHFETVACQTCHVPELMGPAARSIDKTVVTAEGRPVAQYRGVETDGGVPLNATYLRGYRPIVLPDDSPEGGGRLTPFNAVETSYWADGLGGAEIPGDRVARAYLEAGDYALEVKSAFDSDRNGRIDPTELRLDAAAKTEVIRARLRALGVAEPVIRREVSLHRIEHDIQAAEQVERNCVDCHRGNARLGGGLALGPPAAAGVDPVLPVLVTGSGARIVTDGTGTRVEPVPPASLYVLGRSRRVWADRFGFAAFVAVVIGVAVHAGLRIAARRRTGRGPLGPGERAYIYTGYERVWHWLMGFSILVLILTGFAVHFSGTRGLLSLPVAVAVHNFFAAVLTGNAFLALFYHLATSAIRRFVPARKGLVARVTEQANYYTRGIFLGQPHPSPKTPERRLNPLQQLTYLTLLNVLFPLQVVTGILIWGASRWPRLSEAIGGLTVTAPIHALLAWLFLAFVVLHVYLTTTGRTVLSNIAAMIDGYDEVETQGVAGPGPRRAAIGGVHD